MQGRVGRTRGLLLFIAGCLFIFACGSAEAPRNTNQVPKPSSAVAAHLLDLPLSFVPNVGQVAGDSQHQVDFVSAGRGYSLFLTSSQAVLALSKRAGQGEAKGPGVRSAVLRMKLEGANAEAAARGVDELPGKSNYFIGDNPSQWHRDVPTYAKVKYGNVYPGVDLTFYGNQRHLEFDFAVAPKSDPGRIRLALDGATRLTIDRKGDLIAEVGGGAIRFHKPVIYQPVTASGHGASARHFVNGGYVLGPSGRVGLKVSDYDRTKPLIIDPMLSYSTYLGGNGDDSGNGIAVDASGNVYIAGSTGSTDFPTKSPISSSIAGTQDVFVAKLNSSGTALVYSTYLGGNQADQGAAIAIDSSGDAFVAGTTYSSDFPTTSGAYQPDFAGGQSDVFAAKINPAGDTLTYATYLGGTGNDIASGIALDSSGNAYVVGNTTSTNFPTASPVQSANKGKTDAFLSKLKPDGSALVYSTYLGGSGADTGQAVAVDGSGNAYVAGITLSSNFPTASAYQSTYGGSGDAFIAKYNAAGTTLDYSTYLGGTGLDRAFSIAVDSSGNAYVAGDTTSTQFTATSGAPQISNNGNTDAFVAELGAGGTTLPYFTYLGGTLADGVESIAVGGSGNLFVTGYTQSSDFPLLNALDATFGGGTCGQSPCFDAFVSEITPATGFVYSTYLGGSGNDYGQAIALDSSGDAYIAGVTSSTNFPSTAGNFQSAAGSSTSSSDAFVAKISPADNPSVGLTPQSVTFADQATGTTSSARHVTLTNFSTVPLSITGISVSGDFSQTNNCGSSVAANGGSCTINVTFSPKTADSLTGTLTISDNAAGSPQTVKLSGTGTTPAPAVKLSPTSLTLPTTTVGATSAQTPVTVTNSGTADLTITSVAATSSSTAGTDYAETDNCVTTLAPGNSCTINVTFTPASSGSITGTLSIDDNATGSPQSVSLTGTGVAVFSLTSSPTSTIVSGGTASTTFTITLNAPSSFTDSVTLSCTNNGSATCSFSSSSLTAGQTSTLTVGNLVAIAPSTLGFQVKGTSGDQSATASLSVLFKNFVLSVSPPLVTLNAGQSGTYTLTLTGSNGFSDSVAVTCSNLPAKASCSASPSSATVSGSTPTTVTVKITTASNAMMGPGNGPLGPPPGAGTALWLAALLALVSLIVLAGRRALRPRRVWVGVAFLLLLAAGAAACNTSYFNPVSPISYKGTPPGVYTVVINAKSTNYTHSITSNLAVN
ncbi:MAG: SBBP repeat-containing protein [Acidobacteriota bacterium]